MAGIVVIIANLETFSASQDNAQSYRNIREALGRDRVCTLYKSDLELPSDFQGTAYVPMDSGDGWKFRLARELKDAGFQIDLNKIL